MSDGWVRKQLLSHGELLQLKRLSTPTVYNGWEQISRQDSAARVCNREETHDFMPQMGPMVGYAITVVIEPSTRNHKAAKPNAWADYRRYVAAQPGPKIAIVQDLDKPEVIGSFWGEVNSNVHRALGCVGTVVDGAIRDCAEMFNAGFKAMARRLCVGHAHAWPVRWSCPVEVFGTKIQPGQLIHADQHGFLAIPIEDEQSLLEASRFMDANECDTVISAARTSVGLPMQEVLSRLDEAEAAFRKRASAQYGKKGEW